MSKTYIIAEIAQGYEGNPGLCKLFIKAAKNAGADAVKFQIFEAGEISIPGYEYHTLFESLYIQPEQWKELIAYAQSLELDFYADVFGPTTLQWMLQTPVKGIKIHSSDIKNVAFLNALKDKNKNIVLGVGGSTLEEIAKALEVLGKNDYIIMSGFQAEPNKVEDIELHKLKILKDRFKHKVGYADHIEVGTDLAYLVPVLAVANGADCIEKHLTLERDFIELEDFTSALNPAQFKKMVDMIRAVESLPSAFKTTFDLTERELAYRKRSKKVTLTARNIKEGEVLSSADIAFLRTGEKFDELLDLEEIVGKKAKTSIDQHKVIKKEYLV